MEHNAYMKEPTYEKVWDIGKREPYVYRSKDEIIGYSINYVLDEIDA